MAKKIKDTEVLTLELLNHKIQILQKEIELLKKEMKTKQRKSIVMGG